MTPISRNPSYVSFASLLLGQFLVFPNWITLVYMPAGMAVFHRRVLREEAWMKGHYGQAYCGTAIESDGTCDRKRALMYICLHFLSWRSSGGT